MDVPLSGVVIVVHMSVSVHVSGKKPPGKLQSTDRKIAEELQSTDGETVRTNFFEINFELF